VAAAVQTRGSLATTAEAAAYLRRHPGTLRNWRSEGTGPKFTGRGHGVRYRWSDIEKWIDQQSR
jgi:hypothetical protein